MDFAVIKTSGKQYLVKAGDILDLNADLGKVGDKITFSEVLLISDNNEIKIGTPLVSGVKVVGEITFSGKGGKLDIMKFKAKSRYRRKIGFRPLLTKVKIVK